VCRVMLAVGGICQVDYLAMIRLSPLLTHLLEERTMEAWLRHSVFAGRCWSQPVLPAAT